MASEKKSESSRGRSTSGNGVAAKTPRKAATGGADSSKHFAICVRNENYPASLELKKLYLVLEDQFASEHGMIRIIDESGEDYLFPADYFVRVNLPREVEMRLRKIA